MNMLYSVGNASWHFEGDIWDSLWRIYYLTQTVKVVKCDFYIQKWRQRICMPAEKYVVSSGPLRGCGGGLNSLVCQEFRVV